MRDPSKIADPDAAADAPGKYGYLFGFNLGLAENRRAALICAALTLAAGAALGIAGPTATLSFGESTHVKWGEGLAYLTALLATLTALFTLTWAALRFGSQLQWPLLLLVVGGLTLWLAQGATTIPPPGALSSDYWMLAPFLFVFALPAGFAVHPLLPFRSFLIAAVIAFFLILPDVMGYYTMDTGERRLTRYGAMREYTVIEAEAAHVTAFRASGKPVTWYLLCLAAVWAGLLAAPLWRLIRRRPA